MLKNVVYLKEEDYIKLKTNGTVEVNGQTITYSDNDIYMTPDNTDSKLASMEAKIYELGLNTGTKWYKHTRSVSFTPLDAEDLGVQAFNCTISCITPSINNTIIIDTDIIDGVPLDDAISMLYAYIPYDVWSNNNIVLQPLIYEDFGSGAQELIIDSDWTMWQPTMGYEGTAIMQEWLRAAMNDSGGLTTYTISEESIVEL